jgi:intein/homing endonuclease
MPKDNPSRDMSEEESITVAEASHGPAEGEPVELPVVELLTGRAFLTGKSGSGKSVLEGTAVYTESGRKPIEDVEEGERVLSLNKHEYEQEFREVVATIEHESSELLRITLEDGTEVVGTEDHSFLTVEDLEIVPVRGDELEEGTWMPLARELPSTESVERIDLSEYVTESKDLDVREETIRSAQKTEDRYLPLDFETGKVLGLYLAEGSFDSKGTVQISNVDDDVQAFLGEQGFNVYDRMSTMSFRPFSNFLESEFGRGSGGKVIPSWVFDAPDELKAGLLSGYFDGDGSVDDTNATAMSKSPELLAGIKELLRHFGISSNIREKFVMYDGEQRRYERLRVDAFSMETFGEVVEFSVQEKAEKLRAVVAELEGGESYNSKDMIPEFGTVLNDGGRGKGWTERSSGNRTKSASAHHLTRQQKAGRETYNRFVDELDIEGRAKQFGQSDVQWKRVIDVETLDETRTVYDLDVRLNDNFIADGVFVHNSNTASVVAEKLLDRGFGLLLVDIEGEYYGLKEEYEILHAGADEECDIQVSEEHAGKLASLALEQNVPIILDLSGFLHEQDARDLLKAVARQLFAKEKKVKQPFLMVVEEIHEYIPEGGGMDECGRMLVKVAKRGRKHGLGVAGISQRPADVKKDFITQCDWLVWHRLTWQNDTRVVKRVLGSEYADAIEDMDDGEGFLMTDWGEEIRTVQFHRKETFDAGATPGLEDFERPDLKSVSDDLVSELETISEEQAAREDEIARLENELEEREQRIAGLKEELAEARDLSDMAEQFARAMTAQAEPRYDPGAQRNLEAYAGGHEDGRPGNETGQDTASESTDGEPVAPANEPVPTDADESDPHEVEDESPVTPGLASKLADEQRAIVEDAAEANQSGVDDVTVELPRDAPGDVPEEGRTDEDGRDDGGEADDDAEEADDDGGRDDGGMSDDAGMDDDGMTSILDADSHDDGATSTTGPVEPTDPLAGDGSGGTVDAGDGEADALFAPEATTEHGSPEGEPDTGPSPGDPEFVAGRLRDRVGELDRVARQMLACYRDTGVSTPEAVHAAVGESGERQVAYGHNRSLRREGFVVHVGGGRYAYSVPSLLSARTAASVDDDRWRALLETVEAPL